MQDCLAHRLEAACSGSVNGNSKRRWLKPSCLLLRQSHRYVPAEVSKASAEDLGIVGLALKHPLQIPVSWSLWGLDVCFGEAEQQDRLEELKSKFFNQSHCYGPTGTPVLKDGSPASLALGLVSLDFWWVKNGGREEGAEVGTLWWTEQQTSELYPPFQPHSQ